MLRKTVLVMLTALLIFAVPVSAQEEVMELDEVVVTASRYQESIMETPVSIEVIDQEEIEESNAQNIADLLKSTSSIHIKDNGGLSGKSDILIRGFRGDQILVLLDGQPYNDPNSGEIDLKQFPVEIIKKIEILKSPSSSVYGGNALGGVINIITKNPQNNDYGKIKLGLGSYNTQQYNLIKSYSKNDFSFLINYEELSSNNSSMTNNSTDRNDLFVKINYAINNNLNVKTSIRYNDSEINFPGSENPNYNSSGFRDEIDKNINITLDQDLDKKNREITFYRNKKDLNSITTFESDMEIMKKGIILNETNYKFNLHTLNYGIEYYEDEKDDLTDFDDDKIYENKSLYINDRFSINNKNVLNFGLRYDDHSKYDNKLSPRIGYIYRINENLNLNLNAGESYRIPSFLDSYGDPDPAENLFYDLSFKYKTDEISSEIAFFRREVEGYLQYNYQTYAVENLDLVRMKGIEFSGDRNITKNINMALSYTYLDAENKNDDNQLVDMPYNKFNFKISYILDNSKISLNNIYVGKRTSVKDENPGWNEPLYIEMSSYLISDLKISNNLSENKKLAFEINNLFDKEYEVVDGYPMPGRNFMLNLSTKF